MKKRKRVAASDQRRLQQTIHRREILAHPLAAGVSIDRELGSRNLHASRTRAFVSGLSCTTCVDLERRRTLGIRRPKISCFDYDPATSGLLVGVIDLLDQGSVLSIPRSPNSPINPVNPISAAESERYGEIRQLAAVRAEVSSVHITPSRNVVITSAGSVSPPSVHLTRLLDPVDAGNFNIPIDSGMTTQFRMSKMAWIWTSAPNVMDASSVENIAVGTNNAILNLYGHSDWQSQTIMQTDSDVLALSWIGPQTLASGQRNAEVHLWDSRSNGKALRLRHKAAVTGIKSAGNQSQIVVNGLRDSLSLYDLRMIQPPRIPTGVKSARNARCAGFHNASRPLVEYLSDDHQYTYPVGFDVDPPLGVVIASGDSGILNAYALHSGKKLKSWHMDNRLAHIPNIPKSGGLAKCARFIEGPRRCPEILASYESKVQRLAW